MTRYIDADELLRKSIKIEGHFDLPSGKSQNFSAIDVTTIQNFTAADVAPVVHSSWEEIKDVPHGIWDYHFKCRYCGGNTPQAAYVVAPDYCPNCGAKMDGKDGKGNG